MFLKTYEGDVSDLCLTFTVNNDDFGVKEVPLIANGASIEVTNQNKRQYIYLVAKHHVTAGWLVNCVVYRLGTTSNYRARAA